MKSCTFLAPALILKSRKNGLKQVGFANTVRPREHNYVAEPIRRQELDRWGVANIDTVNTHRLNTPPSWRPTYDN